MMDPSPSSEQNGLMTARLRLRRPPIDMAVPARDPMKAVLTLGQVEGMGGWMAASTVLHAVLAMGMLLIALWGLFLWTRRIDDEVHTRLVGVYDVELKDETPPPPPLPEPEEKPEPVARPTPPKAAETPPPPAAAAQAGKVLTADPDPNAPVDLTNTIITGNADAF